MEIELKKIFRILKKRLWLLLLLPALTTGYSAYRSAKNYVPVYQANTTLFVINKNLNPQSADAYNEIMVGQQLVKDYRELIRSRTVTSTVIDELKLKYMTPEALASKILVGAKNDTRIIQISVIDTQPELARNLSEKVAEVFMKKVVELFKVDNVNIIDRAQTPAAPIPDNPYKNIVVFAFIGLFAALGVIFLLEYLDDTIKTTEDVEKKLGLTILGTIPVMNMK